MTRIEHLLFIVAEEAAELAQACSKAARFGIDTLDPKATYEVCTNKQNILQEWIDLKGALEMLDIEIGIVPHIPFEIRQRIDKKKAKIEHYFSVSRQHGTLTENTTNETTT